jgi:plastocyanin
MKAIPPIVVAALLALALGQAAPASTSAPTATASKAARVDMVNFAFRPGTLKIGKGTKVVFSNTSSRPHTATRRGSFDTGRVKPGRSASLTFSRRGTFGYFCKIHPEMRGKIVVG